MGAMLDLVGSAIIFGVLILTVARVQENLNTTMYQNTYNLETQTTAINVARQIEYDFTKIGYRVSGQKIFRADSDAVAFKGALTYGGTIDSIVYSLGILDSATANPRDYVVHRRSNSATIDQRIGLLEFTLMYYDTTNTRILPPITTTAQFNAIRSINVKLRFESREPLPESTIIDSTNRYFGVSWEKLIYARNLGGLNLR